MTFPQTRHRRLRESPALRKLFSENSLLTKDLVQPLFIKEGLTHDVDIPSMPGQKQHTLDGAVAHAKRIQDAGIPAVLLFGIPAKKDARGAQAFAKNGVIQKTIAAIKRRARGLLVISDVCLCEYMSHGHCGHVVKGKIVNDPSVQTLARAALSHARAGADIVAPSDMMDGRVAAMRRLLDKSGFKELPILSYAVKYASSFYAPFREAAESAPSFGDRRSYQMNPANIREAIREAGTDLEEGADILMVKPALAYLDVVRELNKKFSCPIACYSVSGEYSMLKAAAARGWLDEENTVMETHLSMKRAGADILVTYWAESIARWLKKGGRR